MSDEFDTILDRCLADLADGRETIDSCLRRYPAQADRLAVLLPLAERARAVPPPASLPVDKRRALESRLLEKTGQMRSRSAGRPLPVWRRRGALAGVWLILVVLILVSSVSVSASSVPGDVLYPVKRTAEQVRLVLTVEQQQVDLHLEFAQQRLQEMRVLTDRGEVSVDLLTEISTETALVLERVPALPPERQQVLLASLANFQDQHLRVLENMALSVQGDTQAKVLAALADSTTKRQQAVELLKRVVPPGISPGKPSKEPRPTVLKEESRPTQANMTAKPKATDSAEPQATSTAKKTPPAVLQKLTPKAERTPPGQSDRSTPNSPPKKSTKIPKK